MSSRRRRGISLLVLGSSFIVVNDAMIKLASESMPLTQLMFVRGCFATAFLVMLARFMRTPLRAGGLVRGRVLARTALDVASTFLYLTALSFLPLANVTAITMASPLIGTLLAVVVLGERATAARWLAMGAGFAGVLLILQPASGAFNAWSLIILASTAMYSLRDVLTRPLGHEVSSTVLTLISTVLVTLGAGLWGLDQPWPSLAPRQFGVLAIASVLLSTGWVLGTIAMREAEIGVVAPFKYSALIVSSIISYLVWDHVPNAVAWCGIAITVGAGIVLTRSA